MSGNQFNISTPLDTRESVVDLGVTGASTHPPKLPHPHDNDCLMAKKQASTLELLPALARKT